MLGWPETGIRIKGHRSTPGHYFRVVSPGAGWGGTDICGDPLALLGPWQAKQGARPGLRLLMVLTTGEQHACYVPDGDLVPQPAPLPEALCMVMFQAGAGGSLRSGITRNPVQLTRSRHRRSRRASPAALR